MQGEQEFLAGASFVPGPIVAVDDSGRTDAQDEPRFIQLSFRPL